MENKKQGLGAVVGVVLFSFALPSFPDVQEEMTVPLRWKCKWCVFEEGLAFRGKISPEILFQTDNPAFRYRQYNGIDDGSLLLSLSGSFNYFGEAGENFQLLANDLGLASREIDLQYGKTGLYHLAFSYDEINHLILDNAQSPYQTHGNTLLLPHNWVVGGSSQELPVLEASSIGRELVNKRKIWNLNAEVWNTQGFLGIDIEFQRDSKKGNQRFHGAFGNDNAFAALAVELAAPVDYSTDQIELGVNWRLSQGLVRVAYYGSFFSQHIDSIVWENPYQDNFDSNHFGQTATAPNNRFQQVYTEANYRLFNRIHFSAYYSLGEMSQHESLLPYTLTSALETPLPLDTVNLNVETEKAMLSMHTLLGSKWRFSTRVQFDRRDNVSDAYQFDYVVLDSSPSLLPRSTKPYSFYKEKWSSNLRYRFKYGIKFGLGVGSEFNERSYQEVEKIRENSVWFDIKSTRLLGINTHLKILRAERDSDDYAHSQDRVSTENPYLRKSHFSDSDSDQVSLVLSRTVSDRLSLTFDVMLEDKQFPDTYIGLLSLKTKTATVDLSYHLFEHSTFYGFYTKEKYRYIQSGSQADANVSYLPDWKNDLDDAIDTLGFGAAVDSPSENILFSFDYVVSNSIENSQLFTDVKFYEQLPSITSKLHSATAKIDYQYTNDIDISLSLIYEYYREKDFQVSGLVSDSSSGNLFLGGTQPDYDIWLARFSLSLSF